MAVAQDEAPQVEEVLAQAQEEVELDVLELVLLPWLPWSAGNRRKESRESGA